MMNTSTPRIDSKIKFPLSLSECSDYSAIHTMMNTTNPDDSIQHKDVDSKTLIYLISYLDK
jgi:hypothetical protein